MASSFPSVSEQQMCLSLILFLPPCRVFISIGSLSINTLVTLLGLTCALVDNCRRSNLSVHFYSPPFFSFCRCCSHSLDSGVIALVLLEGSVIEYVVLFSSLSRATHCLVRIFLCLPW